MFTVYAYDLGGSDINLVYAPNLTKQGYILTSAKVKSEAGKAGEMSFTIQPTHPLYSKFRKIVTMIFVKWDDTVIWFGRVYGIKRDFKMNKTITCEGALSFLEDICLMPFCYYTKERYTEDMEVESTDDSGNATTETQTVSYEAYVTQGKCKRDHLATIMELYNYRCSEDRKCVMSLDIANADIDTYTYITGTDSYNTILSEIEDVIIDDYNYSIITQYSQDSETGKITPIFHICELPLTSSNQKIEFGVNLIDFEEAIDASEVYNTIVPVGSGNLSIYSDNGEDETSLLDIKYRAYYIGGGAESCGVIDKVVEFSDIEDRDVLYEAGEAVLQSNGGVAATEFTINFVDLRLLGADVQMIKVGDSVRVVSEPHGVDDTFVCSKSEINILNPGSSTYTLKTPEKTSPETLTSHLVEYRNTLQSTMENKKITLNQTYGVLNIGSDSSSLALWL